MMTPRLKANGYRLGDHLPGHRARVVEFVAGQVGGRSCGEIAAMLGVDSKYASTTCWQMVTRSHTLFRGRARGRGVVRFFESQALADAWVQSLPPVETKAQKVARKRAENKVVKAKPSVEPTVRVRSRPKLEGEAIVTEATKRTACPNWSHDPRYQVPPGTVVTGTFSRLGIGRYEEDEKKKPASRKGKKK